jgi:rubrerythrin
MSIDGLLFVYVLSVLAALSAVAIYFELRRRGFGPTPTEDHIFRCEKCGYVYTDDPDVDRSRCPQCGAMNDVFSF